MTAADERRDEPHRAVAFIDLVKFTSLTDVHGDVAGADAATAIEVITRRRAGTRARLVKTAGDGVLVEAPDALEGLRVAGEVIEDVHGIGLDARAGVHVGPVVSRGGDIFGATVNLAARLAGIAPAGMIATTRPVALAARATPWVTVPQGLVDVTGLRDRVEVFTIDPCRHGAGWRSDPVCGMRLDADAAIVPPDLLDHNNLGFCSQRCVDIYSADPDRYSLPGDDGATGGAAALE